MTVRTAQLLPFNKGAPRNFTNTTTNFHLFKKNITLFSCSELGY